jgi:hypothetical protein
MRRLLAWILIVAGLLLVTGATFADGCSAPCPDDPPEGGCTPDCAFCACCPGTRPAVLHAGAACSPLSPRGEAAEEPRSRPVPPAPREIAHVPKPS